MNGRVVGVNGSPPAEKRLVEPYPESVAALDAEDSTPPACNLTQAAPARGSVGGSSLLSVPASMGRDRVRHLAARGGVHQALGVHSAAPDPCASSRAARGLACGVRPHERRSSMPRSR